MWSRCCFAKGSHDIFLQQTWGASRLWDNMLAGPLYRGFHNGVTSWSLHMGERRSCGFRHNQGLSQGTSDSVCVYVCVCPLDVFIKCIYAKMNFCISFPWLVAEFQISFSIRKRKSLDASQELLLQNCSCYREGLKMTGFVNFCTK